MLSIENRDSTISLIVAHMAGSEAMHINGNAPLGSKGAIVTTSKTNYNTFASIYSVIDNFRQAMQVVGIHHSGEIIADGKLHRFHIEGHKHGRNNGAYILHIDNHPAGWFLDHTTGLSQTWRSSGHA